MKRTAHCKINLTLEILGTKRSDGFHDLKSIMHKIPLGDVIELSATEGDGSISFYCDSDVCDPKDNLAYRAAEMYLERCFCNTNKRADVSIKLSKVTPTGAGLGGGSADAACVLDMLFDEIGGVSPEETLEMASKLGSDVPFCLGRYMSAYCTGRGEECRSICTLPAGTSLVIAKPNEGINTKGIYGEYDKAHADDYSKAKTDSMEKALEGGVLADIAKQLVNDFECVCIPRLPEIETIKKRMTEKGAVCSQMSGSGSAVFGLFDSETASVNCYNDLKQYGLSEVYVFNDGDFRTMYDGE